MIEHHPLSLTRQRHLHMMKDLLLLNLATQNGHLMTTLHELRAFMGPKRIEMTQVIDGLNQVRLALAIIPCDQIDGGRKSNLQLLIISKMLQ